MLFFRNTAIALALVALAGPVFSQPVEPPVAENAATQARALDPVAEAFGIAQQDGSRPAWQSFLAEYGAASENIYVRIATLAVERAPPARPLSGGPLPGQVVSLLLPLATAGDPVAQYYVATAYQIGSVGFAQDHTAALAWFRQGALAGYAPAQNGVAVHYYFGLGVEPNERESLSWLRLAADQNFPVAVYALGEKYELGVFGFEQDYAEAFSLYQRSAAEGHYRAQEGLGRLYQGGLGVDANAAEAARWYGLASDQGSPTAQIALAFFYKMGIGVEEDDAEAVALLRRALESNSRAAAAYELASMYVTGSGVEQDYEAAAMFFTIAADQGNPSAQVALGVMFRAGRGVEKNAAEAVRLFRLAADQGYPRGQYNLGRAYEFGEGVPVLIDEAARLYGLAADQGNEEAAGRLAVIGRSAVNP